MPDRDQRKLGEILVNQAIVTARDLEDALAEQKATGRFIGEILVARGAASEEKIAQSLSQQIGLAFVDVSQMSVEPEAIRRVPEDLCRKHSGLPLFIVRDTLTLAMANPLDIVAIDEFQARSGLRIKPVFACPTAIRQAIEKQYREPSSVIAGRPEEQDPSLRGALHRTVQGDEAISIQPRDAAYSNPSLRGGPMFRPDEAIFLKQAASLAPVVEMVNNLITRAVEMNASDIHLEPQREKFDCRYRIDGVLYDMPQIPLDDQAAVISRIKIMANMDIAEKRLPQDGRARMNAAGRDVDLRLSTFPTIYGENLVIRILDRSGGLLKLGQLGFSKGTAEAFSQLIRRPHGIVLVTGPTGSGKTTTLYAALSEINTKDKNIITLEDPVEYELANVRQSQINPKAGLTFATGLRSIVRQDPNVIMIGEIRDRETADIAIHAALTGHLVFSTLHTNDAPSAVTRLIDMGVEPFLAASSIIGILAQRLMRTLCPHCKKEYTPPPELLKQLVGNGRDRSLQPAFYKETGCAKCKQRGFTGRTGIYELLIPNDKIRDLVTRKSSASVLREEAVKAGMKTLRESGLEKVALGVTSVSELLRVTEEA